MNSGNRSCAQVFVVGLLFVCSIAPVSSAQSLRKSDPTNSEQLAARKLESVRKGPLLLRAFLLNFPKGGDLHNHLSGAIYAENYIHWAVDSGLCVNTQTFSFVAPKQPGSSANVTEQKDASTCDDSKLQVPAAAALKNPVLYRDLIDALSLRNHSSAIKADEYQFFDTFPKFGAVSRAHTGEMLAEIAHRAALQNEHYLELTLSVDGGLGGDVADRNPWPGDDQFSQYRESLLKGGLSDVVPQAKARLDGAEAIMRERLGCQSATPDPGCSVTIRYIGEVARAAAKEHVFAQMLACFEVAQADPRVLAVNLVQPEDWLVPVRDYDLHMRMLDFLHGQYPKVNITLHAGELGFGQVMPEVLGTHIPKAIDMGHAQRIGHGVDVMYYPHPADLLREMQQKHVAVEIALTSNDLILGVRGANHPLMHYMKAGVPVVIATDDEGVSRSDITHEYQRAVETYPLTYQDIKRISRHSLEYSFLPGQSLWTNVASFQRGEACAADKPRLKLASAGCQKFLDANEKAKAQWKLEHDFDQFENHINYSRWLDEDVPYSIVFTESRSASNPRKHK